MICFKASFKDHYFIIHYPLKGWIIKKTSFNEIFFRSIHDTPSRKNSDASADGSILRRRTPEKKDGSQKEKEKLIEQEKSETGSVKWDVYKHYLRSIGMLLSVTTILLNMVFQGFSIGSNVWLARWSTDPNAGNDTGTRDMYLGVYGALGAGQGKSFCFCFDFYFDQQERMNLSHIAHRKYLHKKIV